jgi:hypothetical protein
MVRSGRLAIVVGLVGVGAFGVGMLLLLFERWLLAATLGGVFVISTVAATVLMMRAEPEELRRQQEESERFIDVWARGMASAAGAWRTHSHRKRSAGQGACRRNNRSGRNGFVAHRRAGYKCCRAPDPVVENRDGSPASRRVRDHRQRGTHNRSTHHRRPDRPVACAPGSLPRRVAEGTDRRLTPVRRQ